MLAKGLRVSEAKNYNQPRSTGSTKELGLREFAEAIECKKSELRKLSEHGSCLEIKNNVNFRS